MQTNPTIEAYDRYAHVYDEEVISFWDNFPTEFIAHFVNALPGKRILNVGSGSGRDALLLREYGLEVICLDASKSMVDITKSLRFESHQATFEEMVFEEKSFDGVWAYTSLIHISKSEAEVALEKIRSLLRPGGVFSIGAIQGNTEGDEKRDSMPGVERYFKKYERAELRGMVENAGFVFEYELDYQPNKSLYLNQIYSVGK